MTASRRWAFAFTSVLLVVGCSNDGNVSEGARASANGPAEADVNEEPEGHRQSANGPAEADVNDEPPYGAGAEIGQTYEYVLYTHCGIEWARVDGMFWQSTPLDDGSGNPPAGWGNPYDAGELEIIERNVAVYRGGPGAEVEFERTDMAAAPGTCE